MQRGGTVDAPEHAVARAVFDAVAEGVAEARALRERFERHDHAAGLKGHTTHYCAGCGHGLVHKYLAEALQEGLRAAGMNSVGKHFPGHGDTDTDSHVALPVVRSDRARLGALVNRVDTSDRIAPWTFGTAALMRNLAGRGLL